MVVTLALLVVSVAVLGVHPGLVSGQPNETIDDPIITPEGSSPARVVAPDPRPNGAVVIADPRPGDMRTDPSADALPVAYEPPPATDVDRDLVYGPEPEHRLDLYYPAEPDAPVIVFFHSGGWIGGDRSGVQDMAMYFVERGYALASVDYRLAPDTPFPGAVHDAKRAIQWLKMTAAADARIDGDHIVAFGTSAGGHLAAFAAATVGQFEPPDLPADVAAFDSSVVGVVSAVGPTDLVQLYSHANPWAGPMTGAFMGCTDCTADELAIANPGEYLHEGLPPAYWVYGALDPLVDADAQGAAIASQWAEAGAESWLDVADDSDHNLDESLVNMRALEAFLALAVAD